MLNAVVKPTEMIPSTTRFCINQPIQDGCLNEILLACQAHYVNVTSPTHKRPNGTPIDLIIKAADQAPY